MQKPTSPMFKEVVDVCLERRLAFEVCLASDIDDDDPLLQYLPEEAVGTDFRFIYIKDTRACHVHVNKCDHVVYDYDTETLTELWALITCIINPMKVLL